MLFVFRSCIDMTILTFSMKLLIWKSTQMFFFLWNSFIFVIFIFNVFVSRRLGTAKHCRKLYRRALERVWDHVEVVGAAFMVFEQLEGDLETMADLLRRYKARLVNNFKNIKLRFVTLADNSHNIKQRGLESLWLMEWILFDWNVLGINGIVNPNLEW